MHDNRSRSRQKMKRLAIATGAIAALLLSATLISALMGGQGLMWSV